MFTKTLAPLIASTNAPIDNCCRTCRAIVLNSYYLTRKPAPKPRRIPMRPPEYGTLEFVVYDKERLEHRATYEEAWLRVFEYRDSQRTPTLDHLVESHKERVAGYEKRSWPTPEDIEKLRLRFPWNVPPQKKAGY